MKRRAFFKSLIAVAAIAFAEPMTLVEPKLSMDVARAIPNPAWETAEFEISWIGAGSRGSLWTPSSEESERWFQQMTVPNGSQVLRRIRYKAGKDGLLERVV